MAKLPATDRLQLALLVGLCYLLRVSAIGSTSASPTSYTYLSDIFPQLNLTSSLVSPSRPIRLGGQNFTQCCVLALNRSLTIQNGNLSYSNDSILVPGSYPPIDEFETAAMHSFPCGASFDGNINGAPSVRVPYAWCASTCDGWQVSHRDNLQQWIGPLVGFILPCVAFVLSIPRSWKITIPNFVWGLKPGQTVQLIGYIVQMPMALFLVTVDVIVWLSLCFAFAAPMLLSGCYEARFDQKLLRHLEEVVRYFRRGSASLSQELRAKLLFVTLVGNIAFPVQHQHNGRHGAVQQPFLQPQNRPIDEIGRLTETLGIGHHVANTAIVKSQLFGSSVGAPVVFFVGAYIYNLIDIRSRLGDNDTAHALAFGMWWMVIPLLAIMSGLLLASNNQSTLAAIVAPPWAQTAAGNTPYVALPRFSIINFRLGSWQVFASSSEGRFNTVSLWTRGMNKKRWFFETVDDYAGRRRRHSPMTSEEEREINRLRDKMVFTHADSCIVILSAFIIMVIPCLLAGITSYNTPHVGLSCRSLTHLVYFLTQFFQGVVWVWRSARPQPRSRAVKYLGVIVTIILGFFAVFASVGGTLMQLIGVYRNCLCKVPAIYWLRTNSPQAYVLLGTDAPDEITKAAEFWQITAITATVFLCFACAFGWWHQRRLRRAFGMLVATIDQNATWQAGNSAQNLFGI